MNSKRARSSFILGLVLALLLTGCAAPAPSETSTLVAVNLETLEARIYKAMDRLEGGARRGAALPQPGQKGRGQHARRQDAGQEPAPPP